MHMCACVCVCVCVHIYTYTYIHIMCLQNKCHAQETQSLIQISRIVCSVLLHILLSSVTVHRFGTLIDSHWHFRGVVTERWGGLMFGLMLIPRLVGIGQALQNFIEHTPAETAQWYFLQKPNEAARQTDFMALFIIPFMLETLKLGFIQYSKCQSTNGLN